MAALFQRLCDIPGQRAQVVHRQHMRQQIINHRQIEVFHADPFHLTVRAACIFGSGTDEEGVTATFAFLSRNMFNVHRVFFAIHMTNRDKT